MSRTIAGRYVLVDRIGEGSTGTVWRAWDRRRRGFVAAKVIRAYDAGALVRLVREQSLRIDHPHVLAPIGWAAEDRDAVIVTDLVRGGTLDQLLAEQGSLPGPWVRRVLEQLLEALAAVHAAGLVHGDVKPHNLLLEPTGRGRPFVRLGDFGAAVRVGGSALGVTGTDGYLAPELYRGATPDPRQDLYAAGVTAVELLTARAPTGRLRVPRGSLRPLLEAMTDPDPDRRPATAADALERLRAAPHTELPGPRRTRPPVVPDRLAGLARPRSRRTTWLAAACLLAALGCCVVALRLLPG